MLSTGPEAERILRSTQIFWSFGASMSRSSLRVPLRPMSMEGNTRLSESLRSSTISLLPVPLNSSKITSSMREPVSMRAVATMVREPPPSMLRAAPEEALGALQGVAVHAAGEHLARGRHHRVVGAGPGA